MKVRFTRVAPRLQRVLAVCTLFLAFLFSVLPKASAVDATDFGYNSMRAVGIRPLLVILAEANGYPKLAHDGPFYSRAIFGPLGGGSVGRGSVFDYFASVSYGSMLIGSQGVIGPYPIPYNSDDYVVRQAALEAAAATIDARFNVYDRNRDGVISADELLVLVITNLPIAQTQPHTLTVSHGRVNVNATGLGDTANLSLKIHELTHQLGAFDLYGSGGCLSARLSMMSCYWGVADGTESVFIDPWHRMQFGWVFPRVRDMRTAGTELLQPPQMFLNGDGGSETPIILHDPERGTGEFFMLEYRNPRAPGDYDESAASQGLAIWQIVQDGNHHLTTVPVEANREPNYAAFVRGAPSWIQGGNRLYRAVDGDVRLRWLDGTPTGFIVRVSEPSRDGSKMAVSWTSAKSIYQLRSWSFQNVPGSLVQVAVGTNAVWGINHVQQIYRFNTRTGSFEEIPGILRQIAVGHAGAVWGINPAGNIYQFDGSAFVQVPGNLYQISVGGDGEVWGINLMEEIFRFNPSSRAFERIPGSLTQIAVGNAYAVWGINAAGNIFRFENGRFVQIPGSLRQISVGSDGAVWGINSSQRIYRFNPGMQRFEQIPGSLRQIAVGADNVVWGINETGLIFHFNGSNFDEMSGILAQIAVGASGAVWGLN